jgi:hypothetical protein
MTPGHIYGGLNGVTEMKLLRRFILPLPIGGCATLLFGLLVSATAFSQASQLAIGAASMQRILTDKLFSKQGRWYLSENGPCYAYFESPHVRFDKERIYLDVHLSSRVGARVGGNCIGAAFASDVTLSGKLVGSGSTLTLDGVRIDRVADGATADAIGLIDQAALQALPHAFSVDVLAAARGKSSGDADPPISVDRFQITDVTTQASVVVVRFELSLSAP